MIKKIIAYIYWGFGFACASLFVEGVPSVTTYTMDRSAANVSSHVSDNVSLIAGEKLIVTFGFESASFSDVSVSLKVGDASISFTDIIGSDVPRYVGISYLDVTTEMLDAATEGNVIIDFDSATSGVGASILSVSGLKSGNAEYEFTASRLFENSGTVELNNGVIPNGRFVTSGFVCNNNVSADGDPSAHNTSYTNTYHTSVGSSGGSFGYIKSFDSGSRNLAYDSTGEWTNSFAYASWNVAIPESSQASVVISILTICFYTLRRRIA